MRDTRMSFVLMLVALLWMGDTAISPMILQGARDETFVEQEEPPQQEPETQDNESCLRPRHEFRHGTLWEAICCR